MKEKKEVVKHSAAVQIQNNITLLQRRAWNVLLANAYDALPNEERHSINMKELVQALEFDSKNEDYLKEALRALIVCKVEWNVLNKDDQWEWGVTTLLAEASIKSGICTYAYGPTLRERLHNPQMYARISLSMQNKFESKHAQALWELCVDYLGTGREYGETAYIPIATYRKLLGVSEGQYARFKDLSFYVIKKPVEEINRVTDFHVTVAYKEEGRKVTAVKFKIRRVLMLAEQSKKPGTLFPDLEDMPLVVKMLQDIGLSAKDAWEIGQRGFDGVDTDERPEVAQGDEEAAFLHYVREKINLLKRRQASGKVESSTGFLLNAIRKNYANPEFAATEQQKEAQRRQEAKASRERKLEQWRDEKIGLERTCQDEVHALCKEILSTSPELAEEAAKALLQEESWFKKQYKPGRSALENYQKVPGLWIEMDRYLEERYPERFRGIQGKYNEQNDAINRKIAELEQVNV
jgi:Initiator Replication protein